MTRITRREALTGTAAAGLVTMAGFSFWPGQSAAQDQELTVEDVLFDPANPVMGNKDGDVTIVEFFDYQCPYCKANHPILKDVVENDGNVRLVMKDWPIFGAPSILAAQLALGASSLGQYKTASDALMETEGRLSKELIHDTLTLADLDVSALEKAYEDSRKKWDGLMARNSRQATLLGLQGTPAFIIGKTIYPGSMSDEALRDAIAKART
ncbi:MAG: DsbA family protein [Sulfitobacter sp.]